MATHDYVIDNSTGANVRADINNALAAIVSNNSSSSEPSTKYAYMWWADTTTGILKIRNSANDGWVELLQLDGTLTLEDGSASTPGLAFRDDLNTGIFSSAADTFNVATGGVERMELGATTIFNEDGADVDFRIEGDTDANLFHVDAGNDRIGISTTDPTGTLSIESGTYQTTTPDTTGDDLVISGNQSLGMSFITLASGSSNNNIYFGDTDDTNIGMIRYAHANNSLQFRTNTSEQMRIDSSGRVGIGTTSASSYNNLADDLVVATSSDTGITIATGTSSQGSLFFADGTSGSALVEGFVAYEHGSNFLKFGTSNAERMRIDSSGHMGLGVTPDDGWPSNGDYRAFQLGTGACVFGRGSGDEDRGGFAVNYYATGSGNKFLANGHANLVYLNDGNIDFYTSAQNTSGADADLSLIHVMNINPNKNVEIKDGNLIIGTSGHGIDFSATGGGQGATSDDSELLDDYEEGSFVLALSAMSVTAHNENRYVKIGNLVYITARITLGTANNPSATADMSGLPYAPLTSHSAQANVIMEHTFTDTSGNALSDKAVAIGIENTGNLQMKFLSDQSSLIQSNIGGQTFRFSLTYTIG